MPIRQVAPGLLLVATLVLSAHIPAEQPATALDVAALRAPTLGAPARMPTTVRMAAPAGPVATPVVAGPALAEGFNWSGYLANAPGDRGAYVAVSAEFTEPHVRATACRPESDVSTWVGLGGFNVAAQRRVLVQAGTSVENDMTGVHRWAWYQYLVTDLAGRQTGGGETTRLALTVNSGDRIRVLVRVAGAATFEVRNMTTDTRATAVLALPAGVDGSTAEAITERTIRLARFGAVHWHQAAVQRRDGSWHALTAEPGLTAVRMLSGSKTISAPSPAASGGFTTHWLGCGR